MKKFNFIFLFIPILLSSQRNLSLKEAIRLGLESQFQIKIAKVDQLMAENNNSWSNAGAYPEINLNANPNLISNSIDQKFVNGTEINRKNALSKNINANIQVSYNILNGFNLFTTKEKLESIQLLSEAQIEQIVLDVYKSIAEAYYKVLNLQNHFTQLEAQKRVVIDREHLEEKRYNLGKVGKQNYLQASIDRQDLEILIQHQKNSINEARAELFHIIHIIGQEEIILSDSLDLNLIDKNSSQNNISIPEKILNLQAKINKLENDEIKRQRLPNLNLLADYHYNRSNNQAGFNLFSQSYGPSAGLQITIPIFNGARTNREITQNKLESDKINLQLEDWKRELQYQLNIQKNRSQHFRIIYTLENSKLPMSQEQYQILNKKSDLGESDPIAQSQALFRIVEINASMNDALYNAILAKIAENYLLGIVD